MPIRERQFDGVVKISGFDRKSIKDAIAEDAVLLPAALKDTGNYAIPVKDIDDLAQERAEEAVAPVAEALESEIEDRKEAILEVKELVSYTNADLNAHIEDSQSHLEYGDRERWDSKISQQELANEAQKIEDIKSDVKNLLPWGTDNQVMLGSGKKTLASTTHDAASSLFATASVLGKDVDYIYCQKGNRSIRVRWRDLVLALAGEFVNGGLIPSPPDVLEIESVSLSIDPPVNGTELDTEVGINDSDPNYEASEIMWEPLGLVNSTQTYTASFSIFPVSSVEDPFEFAQDVEIMVNGQEPANVNRETSGALNITAVFPPTMTALPTPSLSIAEPEYGATRPSEAVQNDDGKDNYDNSIIWTPPGATFPAGVSTGDFSLIAKPDHRWNADDALLNGNAVPGNDRALSADGMRLNIIHRTASFEEPFPDRGWFGGVWYAKMPDGRYWQIGPDDSYLYLYSQMSKITIPPGWHLPTESEWNKLLNACNPGGGKKLKSATGWMPNGPNDCNGTDYGFCAYPVGYVSSSSGTKEHVGYAVGYWVSDARKAKLFQGTSNAASTFSGGVYHQFSYRLVKD